MKLRCKNQFGALQVQSLVFLIQNEKVVRVIDMSPGDMLDRYNLQKSFPPGSFPGEGPLREHGEAAEVDASQKSVIDFLSQSAHGNQQRGSSNEKPRLRFDNKIRFTETADSVTLYDTPFGNKTLQVPRQENNDGKQSYSVDSDIEVNSTPAQVVISWKKGRITDVTWDGRTVRRKTEAKSTKDSEESVFRKSTDSTGKNDVLAKFVGYVNRRVILQRQVDGKEVVVQLEKLSSDDQHWVHEQK